MKYFCAAIFTIVICSGLFSAGGKSLYNDSALKRNSFFISLGGRALVYSAGYDRTILKTEKFFLSASVEMGYAPFTGMDGLMIPATVSSHFGRGKNKILLGVSLGNYVDLTPYPKTRSERAQAMTDGTICTGHYEPPYKVYFIPSLGYERHFSGQDYFTVFFSPFLYTRYVPGTNNMCASKMTFFPWGGIAYHFKF